MKLYSTKEASAILEISEPYLRKLARRLNLARKGHDYIFTRKNIEDAKKLIGGKVGRPRKYE